MKREELTAMGLTDEQIEKIIAENSKDVQAANAKANKNSEELTRLRELEKEYTAILADMFGQHSNILNKSYGCYMYRATDEIYGDARWHPSIHMPKEAARIWLKVTDVRVERLQEITEKQACMEGTDPWDEVCYENNGWHPTFSDPDSGGDPNMIDGFHKLWNSTIKKSDLDRYGWDANPYVWVISFERCEKPKGV